MVQIVSQRREVYAALDSERKYQDEGYGNASGGPLVSEGDFIAAITAYLSKMVDAFRINDHDGYKNQLRKVTALGVQGMERLGAVDRQLPELDGNGKVVGQEVCELPAPNPNVTVVLEREVKSGVDANTGFVPNAGALG